MAADKHDDIPDSKKTIFDWCREGNIDKIKLLLKAADSNIKDENVSELFIVQLNTLSHTANDTITLGM